MLRRMILALLVLVAPTLGHAQSYGSSRFDAITVNGAATAGSLITPSLKLGTFTVTGIGTTAGTLAAGNDARIVGATQNSAAAITGGTINGTTIGGTTPAPGSFTTLTLGTALPFAQGGCGATSSLGCLTNLGLTGGTSGYVLTSTGPGNAPTYQVPSPGAGAVRSDTAQNPTAPQIAQALANVGALFTPQGRLTLSSGVPVLTSAVSAAGTVYYTPAGGQLALVGNGLSAAPTPVVFAEVSQTLSDATKSPGAAVAGNVYDLFAWVDGSTVRVTRGPPWTAGASAGSNTARGTGAGSTELTRVGGVLVNKIAITNGPAAGYGVYVGTIATDAAGATVTFNPGSSAAGGGAAWIGLWNLFNREPVEVVVKDSTSSWTYAGSAMRAANNSTGNRVTLVIGQPEQAVSAQYVVRAGTSANAFGNVAIGLDSVAAAAAQSVVPVGYSTAAQQSALSSPYRGAPGAGLHYLQALEAGDGTNAAQFLGGVYQGLLVGTRF